MSGYQDCTNRLFLCLRQNGDKKRELVIKVLSLLEVTVRLLSERREAVSVSLAAYLKRLSDRWQQTKFD